MDGRSIEPRTVLWAVAEVFWEDQGGAPNRISATLEDTSPSGACIRVKTPIQVGSRLTVKWHREQFSAVARNCRSEGREFLLGVRKESSASSALSNPLSSEVAKAPAPINPNLAPKLQSSLAPPEAMQIKLPGPAATPAPWITVQQDPVPPNAEPARIAQPPKIQYPDPAPRAQAHISGSSARQERKVMQSKGLFPKFWRSRQDGSDAPVKAAPTEAPVKQSHPTRPEGITGQQQTDLLSYEDIYHAAGILSPRSGYSVHKVVDMLNSDRIRELSKDIKRASVLMALDAAGTSPDDLLQDVTRRQQALNSYEAGQQKQLEEFEARKAQEDAHIQAEIERVTAHYAERLKQNHEQVAREKEALRNWQMAKEHEMQRISEVIELCAKQPVSAPRTEASAARPTALTGAASPQSSLASKASTGH